MYSPGFDGDDDNLLKTYNPYEVNFSSSLLKDGDVFLQIETVVDFLGVLKDPLVALRENKPDSTLKPVKQGLWDLAKCYSDTVISGEDRMVIRFPRAGTEYGETWFEFRKINGTTTLRLYSELDPLLIKGVEMGFFSKVNERDILREADNIAIGFTINLLSWPQYCQPASTRLP